MKTWAHVTVRLRVAGVGGGSFNLSVVKFAPKATQPKFPVIPPALNSALWYRNSNRLSIFATQAVYTLGNTLCQSYSKPAHRPGSSVFAGVTSPLALAAFLWDSLGRRVGGCVQSGDSGFHSYLRSQSFCGPPSRRRFNSHLLWSELCHDHLGLGRMSFSIDASQESHEFNSSSQSVAISQDKFFSYCCPCLVIF